MACRLITIEFREPVWLIQAPWLETLPQPMQTDEADLITRTQSGDLDAFNAIVERYQSHVYNLSARIMGNMASAEDATQETFISAYRAIRRYRGGSFRGWLLRIATNQCYDMLRAMKRRPADSLDEALLNPAFQVASGDDSPEQLSIRGELAEQIQRAILTLPEEQRVVIVLIDVQGYSYEETAEAAGVSIGTIKSRLSRARARLRAHLKQHMELLPEEFRQ